MISLFFIEGNFGVHFFEIPELERLRFFISKSVDGFKPLSKKDSIARIMLKLPNTNKFSKFLLFLKLIKKLCDSENKPLTQFIHSKTISGNEGKRMQCIFDYVINNFQNNISLDAVSELAFMTPSAFCRFFKNRTNKTFFQFLIEFRIEHACQLLKSSHQDLSVKQIAAQSGFRSISNFNRKFKQLKGMTPSQYFNQTKNEPIYADNR